MDWNWYFSTLSQSAAGIVGIVGAFIITKILNNQAIFLQKTAKTQQLLAESKLKQATAEHLKIKWFNHQIAREQHSDFKALIKKDMERDEIYTRLYFSIYMAPDEAKVIIEEWITDYIQKREEKNKNPYAASISSTLSIPTSDQMQYDREHQRSVEAEGNAIDKSYIECQYQTEVNRNHHSDVFGNPESSREISITIILLSLLFLIGVIYPISFLPSPPGGGEFSWAAIPKFYFSLKGFLLVLVSILFLAIVRMFYKLNSELIYPENEVNKLKKYTLIGTYSSDFIMRDLNELGQEHQR